MNRDFEKRDRPAWQWWYYEVKCYIKTSEIAGGKKILYSQDAKTGKPLAIKEILLKHYYKWPLMRTLADRKLTHSGQFFTLFLSPQDARDAPEFITS